MQENENKSKKGRNKIAVYLLILFIVAFLLMLFSYLISERNNSIAMENLTNYHSQTTATAFENIELLQQENESLRNDMADSEKECAELRSQISELETQIDSLTNDNKALEEFAARNETAIEFLLALEQASAKNDMSTGRDLILQAKESCGDMAQCLTAAQLECWEELVEIFE